MKLNKLFLSIVSGCLLMAIPTIANAEIMAIYQMNQFDFDVAQANPSPNANGSDEFAATQVLPAETRINTRNYNTRTSDISDTQSATPTNKSHAFFGARSSNTSANSFDGGVANNNYHEFSVDILSGNWTIDSLSFDYWVNALPDDGNFRATIYTNLDGYSEAVASRLYTPPANNQTEPRIDNVSFDNLNNNPIFQDLTSGSTPDVGADGQVGFRIVFSDNIVDNSLFHRIDDVILTGTVSDASVGVPEPNSLAILGLVGVAVATRRRRR